MASKTLTKHAAKRMMRRFTPLLLVALLVPSITLAADGVLFLSPERGTYTIGDVFEVEILADTDGEVANAAEADIAFNPSALEVVGISTDGSELSLWPTEPIFSNAKGSVRFSGTASRSFQSERAVLIRIQFKALSNVPGDVQIVSGALLLNNARATNIIASMRSGLYTVVPRQTLPQSAPEVSVPTTSETIVESPAVMGASVQVPSISGYDDRVSIGERIVLQGSGTPSSKIVVFLQYEDDAPRESAVLTTSDGSFTYVASELAQRGVYRAWASVQTDAGLLSSDKVVIVARSDGFAAAAEAIVPMLTLALPYLVLLIAAGVSLGYFYDRKVRARTTGASE